MSRPCLRKYRQRTYSSLSSLRGARGGTLRPLLTSAGRLRYRLMIA